MSCDVPDLNCSSRPHFPFGATPPLGVLSSIIEFTPECLQKYVESTDLEQVIYHKKNRDKNIDLP